MEAKVQRHLSLLYLSKTPVGQFFDLINKHMKNEFDVPFQEQFASCTFDHRLARRYPLSPKYRLAFIKKLIKHIESQGQEIAEPVYEEYTNLLAAPSSSSSSSQFVNRSDPHSNSANESMADDECHYVTRLIQDKYVVTKQSDALVTDGTTGLRFWEGGMQLFEQIFVNQKMFKDKKILELGAGNGFTGIAISKFCQLSGYIFTDHHYRVFQLIKENLRLNGFSSSDLLSTDRKLNKFYETEDEEGNVSTKYYENEVEASVEEYKNFDNKTSYFLDSKSGRSVEKISGEELIEKSMHFDRKLNDLNVKLTSFEDFLESFKEKLTLIDEKLHTAFDGYENGREKWNFGGQEQGKEGEDEDDREEEEEEEEGNENLNKNVVVCELDWTSGEEEIRKKISTYAPDFIVGADIVYDPDLIPDLVKVLKVSLNALPNVQIILVCTVRNEDTIRLFDEQLERLQRYQDIEFQKAQLSPKFTIFKHLQCSQPFALYNIHNVKE